MPSPLREKLCAVCGRPFSVREKSTMTCSTPCAYTYRSRQRATPKPPPLVAVTPAPPEPLIAPPVIKGSAPKREQAPRPLVAPRGHVTPARGREEIRSRSHLVIPDCQVADGVPTEHLEWVGRYIADKRPDVIVCLGDFADMKALCAYDRGKRRAEGQRYVHDIEAARSAMERLTEPFRSLADYRPRMVLTLGNHEDRISRAVEDFAVMEHAIGLHDLAYESFGWEVYPFLEVVKIDGIEYSHYFTSGPMGKACSSAAAVMRARQGSAVQGHVQHTDIFFHPKTQRFTLLAGTCYLHDEDYLGAQGNVQRRQIVMLHEVEDGRADPMFVSLEFLRRKYAA